jgi:hypothetical protein
MQILYFDSVETGFIRVEPTALPRIAFFTGAVIMVLIDEDTKIIGDQKIYGIMPVSIIMHNFLKKIGKIDGRYMLHNATNLVSIRLRIMTEEILGIKVIYCTIR